MSKRYGVVVCSLFLFSGCASIVIDEPKGAQPAAAPPVPVAFRIEITKSVYGRTADVNGMAINISAFSSMLPISDVCFHGENEGKADSRGSPGISDE
jgi:hypothetical protein